MYNKPYRGQRYKRLWVNIVIILSVILLLSLGFFLGFLFIGNFVSINDDGIEINIPEEPVQDVQPAPIPSPEADVVEPNNAEPPPITDVSPITGGDSIAEVNADSKAIYTPPKKLLDDNYINNIISLFQKGHINSVMVDMKTPDGMLYYNHNITEIKTINNITYNNADKLKSSISKLKDSGIKLIARVYVYRDNIYPRYKNASINTKGDTLWQDSDRYTYISPYSSVGLDYIKNIALEISSLGFSEIILHEFLFPTRGNRDDIAYSASEDKTYTITKNIGSIADVLDESKTTLSIYLTNSQANTAKNEELGFDITEIAKHISKIYIGVSSGDSYQPVADKINMHITEDVNVLPNYWDIASFKNGKRELGFALFKDGYNYYDDDF